MSPTPTPPTKPAAKKSTGKPARKPQASTRRRAPLALVLVGVVVLVLLGAVVFNAVRKDNSSASSSSLAQVQPVTVKGDALPEFGGDTENDAAVGTTAPVLEGQSFDGSKVTIGGATGKPTLIMFVAHWCPHCQREVPVLVDWLNSAQKPADLKVTAISTAYNQSSENSPASTWLTKANWPTPVVADSDNSDAANAYGLRYFPYLVVLGPDGTVKGRTTGEMTADEITQFVNGALGH